MNGRARAAGIFFTLLSMALWAPAASAFIIDFQHQTITEFVNDFTGHYFLADARDTGSLLQGGAGGGWRLTGHQFQLYNIGYGTDVCRFYAPGPNTHFYTASAAECSALRDHPEYGWIYEGVKFGVDVPVDGQCAGPTLNRWYNNRFAFNDSNHRYVDAADTVSRDELIARGWTNEGPVFCAFTSTHLPIQSVYVDSSTGPVRPANECRNESAMQGSCIALDGIAGPMSRQIGSSAVAPPTIFSDLTHVYYPVFTNLLSDDMSVVAAHSFLQLLGTGIGVRVTPLDHISGALGSIDPMYTFATRAPLVGFPEGRVFPWRVRHEAAIELAFRLSGGDIRRSDPDSHAWGAAAIAFRDTVSGRSIDVTLQTYGTIPPGDFAGAVDASNDHIYVSTVFRADPSFGIRVAGDFVPCAGNGACAMGDYNGKQYTFRLGRDDFVKVLALARAANPNLSANPDDYLLVNFRFQNGIVGDASLAAGLTAFHLDTFGY